MNISTMQAETPVTGLLIQEKAKLHWLDNTLSASTQIISLDAKIVLTGIVSWVLKIIFVK